MTFAEKHRHILNHILRQSKVHLSDGQFSVLIDHPRLLDFDVKRKYFKKELSRPDDNRARRYRNDMPLRIRQSHVFQDSFRELFRLQKQDWKNRFYIMFDGEEGQDAGGVLREWYSVVTKDIFNPNYALFKIASGDGVTHMINPSSYINIEHLDYFKIYIWMGMMFIFPFVAIFHIVGAGTVLCAFRTLTKKKPELAYLWTFASLISDFATFYVGMFRFFIYELKAEALLNNSPALEAITPTGFGLLTVGNLILMGTSIDRLIAIKFPIWYRVGNTNRRFLRAIPFILILSLSAAVVSYYEFDFLLVFEMSGIKTIPDELFTTPKYVRERMKQQGGLTYIPNYCWNAVCYFVDHQWWDFYIRTQLTCMTLKRVAELADNFNYTRWVHSPHTLGLHDQQNQTALWMDWIIGEITRDGPLSCNSQNESSLCNSTRPKIKDYAVKLSHHIHLGSTGCIKRADDILPKWAEQQPNQSYGKTEMIRKRFQVCLEDELACFQEHCGALNYKRWTHDIGWGINRQSVIVYVNALAIVILVFCTVLIVQNLRRVTKEEKARKERENLALSMKSRNSNNIRSRFRTTTTTSLSSTATTTTKHGSGNRKATTGDQVLPHIGNPDNQSSSNRQRHTFHRNLTKGTDLRIRQNMVATWTLIAYAGCLVTELLFISLTNMIVHWTGTQNYLKPLIELLVILVLVVRQSSSWAVPLVLSREIRDIAKTNFKMYGIGRSSQSTVP